jgi:hypothetical protein
MTDFTFLPAEATDAKHEIVQALYDRLKEVRRAINAGFPSGDEFELGIDCRLANEELWLEELLNKIERS